MPIAQMIDGAPRVEVQSDGKIGCYAVDKSDEAAADPYIGFLLDRATALATGLRLIAALQNAPAHQRPMLEMEAFEGAVVRERGRDDYCRLEFTVQGAKLPVYLDRPQLADLIAGLAVTLKEM